MHYLYYVAIKKENKKSSKQLKEQAYTILDNNNFAGEGTFFNCPKADWFVVGGRWSGSMTDLLHKDFQKKLFNKYPKAHGMTNRFFSDEELQKALKDKKSEVYLAEKEWKKKTGATIYRDTFNHLGYEDDAQLLTPSLIKALKKQNYEDTEVCVVDEDGAIEDEMTLKTFLNEKDIVNNYYLVVIDYHN